jgi:cysteine desulfurase
MLPQAVLAVKDAMLRWANPSSPHSEGRAARAALEDARHRIAAAYGWPHELILTSGASESLYIALRRSMAKHRLITAVEHDSVLRHSEGAGVLAVRPTGQVDLDALRAAMQPGTLVCVQWANSETGVKQPIESIARIVREFGGLLLVDAAQMPARADDAPLLHADFIAVSAHKRGGPPGIGALMIRDFATLLPVGGQEKGYRAGTENLPGALGYAAALEVPEPLEPLRDLRRKLDFAVEQAGGTIVGYGVENTPAIRAYRMPGLSAAAQLIRFDLAGYAVSAGSACSSGSMRPSHVLTAMGWQEPELREVIRVSFGRKTSKDETHAFAKLWQNMAQSARHGGLQAFERT